MQEGHLAIVIDRIRGKYVRVKKHGIHFLFPLLQYKIDYSTRLKPLVVKASVKTKGVYCDTTYSIYLK